MNLTIIVSIELLDDSYTLFFGESKAIVDHSVHEFVNVQMMVRVVIKDLEDSSETSDSIVTSFTKFLLYLSQDVINRPSLFFDLVIECWAWCS